jgi:hypothetical protein
MNYSHLIGRLWIPHPYETHKHSLYWLCANGKFKVIY